MTESHNSSRWNRREYLKVGPAAIMLGAAGCLGDDDGGNGDGNGNGNGNGEVDWRDEVEEIEFLTWQLDFLEESAQGWASDFEDEHGVRAEWIDRPAEEFIQWFQSRVGSGDPPAAVNTPYVWYNQFSMDDVFADVESYVSDDLMATFEDRFGTEVLEQLELDGTLYGLPWYDAGNTMYFNQGFFDDAGLDLGFDNPWSFQEFLDEMEMAYEETDAEWGWTGTTEEQYPWFLPYLRGWEPQIDLLTDDLSDVAFDNEHTVELLSEIQRHTEEGIVPDLTWTERKQPQASHFAAGETVAFLSDSSIFRVVANEGDWVDADSLGVTSWPLNPHTVDPMLWSATSQRSDAEKIAAHHFIEVTTNMKWSEDFLRNTTVLMNTVEANQQLANDDEFIENNPILAMLYEQYFAAAEGGNVYAPPPHEDLGEISDTVGTEFTSAFLGEKDPEQAVEDAARNARQFL